MFKRSVFVYMPGWLIFVCVRVSCDSPLETPSYGTYKKTSLHLQMQRKKTEQNDYRKCKQANSTKILQKESHA